MENRETKRVSTRADRNQRTIEAREIRKKRERATGIALGVVAAGAFTFAAFNSDRVSDDPAPQPENQQSTSIEQSDGTVVSDSVEPGSIRTVTFEKQSDGEYLLQDKE